MSTTSVNELIQISGEIEGIIKRVDAEIQSINSKLSKIESACTALNTYNKKPVAEEPKIKTDKILVMSSHDAEYNYSKYEQREYENIWEISGQEEGLETTKYVEDNLKEMVEDVRTESKQAADVISNTATEIAKNEDLSNKTLADEVKALRTIATRLKEFVDNEDNRVDIAAYRVNQERKKIVDTAKQYVGKIPYNFGGKPTADGNVPAGGLDCSGFVEFVYQKAKGKKVCSGGTAGIWKASKEISQKELKIGDVGFMKIPGTGGTNHIGIYAGKNKNGEDLWVHENDGDHNVACNTAMVGGKQTFKYYRRINTD